MRSNPFYIFAFLWLVLLGFGTQAAPTHGGATAPTVDSVNNTSKESATSLLKKVYSRTKTDTSTTEVIQFDAQLRSKYLSDEEFNYQSKKKESSALTRFLKNLSRLIEKLFALESNSHIAGINQIIIRIIYGIVLLIGLFIVVKYFVRNKGFRIFSKKDLKIEPDINNTEQLIQSANFYELIEANERIGDTRQSIRLYYLWLLRILKEQEIIEWLPEKTNNDYLSEIKNDSLRKKFAQLSYLYNYIWYGEFSVTEQEYIKAKNEFISFIGKGVLNG